MEDKNEDFVPISHKFDASKKTPVRKNGRQCRNEGQFKQVESSGPDPYHQDGDEPICRKELVAKM